MSRSGDRVPASNRGAQVILAGAVVILVVVAVLVFLGAPREARTAPSRPFTSIRSAGSARPTGAVPDAVTMELTVDSINATTGSAEVRLVAIPGPAIPPEGAVVFSSLAAQPTIVIHPHQLNSEVTAVLSFSEGTVTDYPFEHYQLPVSFVVLSGTDPSLSNEAGRRSLPFGIQGTNDAAGITVTATHETTGDGQLDLLLHLSRTFSTRGWVVAMMAIYWVLALGAAAIAVSVVVGLRPFETRLLAWLSALLFALISFRTAAPGSPPIGTFLDFYAVFEAVGIVSASLLALMIVYLARSRRWLEV